MEVLGREFWDVVTGLFVRLVVAKVVVVVVVVVTS